MLDRLLVFAHLLQQQLHSSRDVRPLAVEQAQRAGCAGCAAITRDTTTNATATGRAEADMTTIVAHATAQRLTLPHSILER
jgi:hypothetical protein